MTPSEHGHSIPICAGKAAYHRIFALSLLVLCAPRARGAEGKRAREEAQFTIYVAGKEIGQEKFSIQDSGDSISSNSIVTFRDPNQHQNVRLETQLNMNTQYFPQTYQLRTTVGGRKGAMTGTFAPGEAKFQYLTNGTPRKSGLLMGDRYIVLDTNVFHHFVFIGRLFDFSSTEKSQSLEVVIPQEIDSGILKISEVGMEKISMYGKQKNLHHLRADSGPLAIDLWVDDQHILYKIALPTKRIEVRRNF